MHLALFLKGNAIGLKGDAPDTTCGASYNFGYTVQGGTWPYNFQITSGSLPQGLTINPVTGVISGTVVCEVPLGPPPLPVPQLVADLPVDRQQLTSWNSDFLSSFTATIPAGRSIVYWALNQAASSMTQSDQYELYVNNVLLLTTSVFPVGSQHPRIYYRLPVSSGDAIRAVSLVSGQSVGAMFAASE